MIVSFAGKKLQKAMEIYSKCNLTPQSIFFSSIFLFSFHK